ncbi:uncharacterized protein PGTG_14157 [Puccinia graminis f. sp. tritici CRL 75-36-700-3]|uniref:Uncharacterized protein n=1 Tax=Puccinia graminis f. sp. tritici (strain CRL 75-36-700-3 / race SCCL) TaxID=418459 RepID=E3KX48_PUCGT|nr:uncharacterized protein PGTG_14157 [Puccinia graminis f. sp. tritici CRL 75-36-700-3]EFP88818.1 hypothetical protein PGTG_14157 [Puccinia graminis f. sp. tritici CRL 75-36-700-3]
MLRSTFILDIRLPCLQLFSDAKEIDRSSIQVGRDVGEKDMLSKGSTDSSGTPSVWRCGIDGPCLSECQGEINYIRSSSTLIVYKTWDCSKNDLMYGGSLKRTFEPSRLKID